MIKLQVESLRGWTDGERGREREGGETRGVLRWQECVGGAEDGGRVKQLPSLGGDEEEGGRAAKGRRWAGEQTHYLIQLTPHDENKCAAGLWILHHIALTLLLIKSKIPISPVNF